MEQITEEMKVHEQWYKESKGMTLDKLPAFLKKLTEDYGHDYGTICHALAAGAIATIWAMDNTEQGGITGFQASCIMWSFIRHWDKEHNKTGMRLIDYDNMLFPQYKDKFEKTISSNTWKAIQDEAKALMGTGVVAHSDVEKHWQSIVNGKVPFGYKVKEGR